MAKARESTARDRAVTAIVAAGAAVVVADHATDGRVRFTALLDAAHHLEVAAAEFRREARAIRESMTDDA